MALMFSRRAVAWFGAGALAAMSGWSAALAGEPVEIGWEDLIPSEAGADAEALGMRGVVQHGEMSSKFEQETEALVTKRYDGQLIRIPGYMVPMEYSGEGVTAFILAPYVGACIHVPPPPPNQLIFVTSETPFEFTGIFDPVVVTGVMGASAVQTKLAKIGYAISAERIDAYE